MTPIIMDIEASGFGVGSYPIEVGVIFADGSNYAALIKPQQEWTHWDSAAARCHGLSRQQLQQYGRSAHEVAEQLNRRLNGKTLYSDAWSHDSSWLDLLFDAVQLPRRFRLESVRALLPESQLACWNANKKAVMQQLQLPRHRALADAQVLQQTIVRTLQSEQSAMDEMPPPFIANAQSSTAWQSASV